MALTQHDLNLLMALHRSWSFGIINKIEKWLGEMVEGKYCIHVNSHSSNRSWLNRILRLSMDSDRNWCSLSLSLFSRRNVKQDTKRFWWKSSAKSRPLQIAWKPQRSRIRSWKMITVFHVKKEPKYALSRYNSSRGKSPSLNNDFSSIGGLFLAQDTDNHKWYDLLEL